MNTLDELEKRPKRPFGYIEKGIGREENLTIFTDNQWKLKVEKSILHDKELEIWLTRENKKSNEILERLKPLASQIEDKEQIKPNYIHKSSLAKLIKSEYEKIHKTTFDDSCNEFVKLLIDHCFHFSLFNEIVSQIIFSSLIVHKMHGQNLTIDRKKGLFIIGDYGYGKTSIIKTIDAIIESDLKVKDVANQEIPIRHEQYLNYLRRFRLVPVLEIVDSRKTNQTLYNDIESRTHLTIDFDDIIREFKVKIYGGDEVCVIREILSERHRRGLKTNIITNFSESKTVDEVIDIYGNIFGGALYDRFFTDFNLVELKGKSKRK